MITTTDYTIKETDCPTISGGYQTAGDKNVYASC